MGRKIAVPGWFKDSFARYRAMRSKGDIPVSEMYDLLADDVQDRHMAGDLFGRSVWINFITGYDNSTSRSQAEEIAEQQALADATGYLQMELLPREVLEKLGLPTLLDLGGWGKKMSTADAVHSDMQKAIDELRRKRDSWDTSLDEKIVAFERALAILPADDSKTLRQVIADPDEYGYDADAL